MEFIYTSLSVQHIETTIVQGYSGTPSAASFGPGHTYPGLIRPGAPGSGPAAVPSRQSTPAPAPLSSVGPAGPGPSPSPGASGTPVIPQGPYPPYIQAGQPSNQQPRQPSFGRFSLVSFYGNGDLLSW